METTQKVMTTRYVRFKVTAYLCLRSNERAGSLSTLIAVTDNRDTPHKTGPTTNVVADG